MVEPQELDQSEIEAFDSAYRKIRDKANSISQKSDEPVWFGNLLIRLLEAILHEYEHLKVGYQTFTPLAAWACRNRLELKIIGQYVISSEANAKRFCDNIFVDRLVS